MSDKREEREEERERKREREREREGERLAQRRTVTQSTARYRVQYWHGHGYQVASRMEKMSKKTALSTVALLYG
jgi:hypothetical protein